MDNLKKRAERYEKMLTTWALGQKLIRQDQEIKLAVNIRKKRTEVVVERWRLKDAEWDTIFALSWTKYQRIVLETFRNKRDEPLRPTDIFVPRGVKGRRVSSGIPTPAVYWGINKAFEVAGLPFRIRYYSNETQPNQVWICVALCSFRS